MGPGSLNRLNPGFLRHCLLNISFHTDAYFPIIPLTDKYMTNGRTFLPMAGHTYTSSSTNWNSCHFGCNLSLHTVVTQSYFNSNAVVSCAIYYT